jgi:hypothetical protein
MKQSVAFLRTSVALSVLLLGAFVTTALAGDGGEVAGLVGLSHYGDGGGNHSTWGGSGGVYVGSRVLLRGELAYTRLWSDGSDSGKLVDLYGGADVNLTSKGSRVVPYVGFGLGGGQRIATSDSARTLVVSGAFGARLYAGRKWGVKPEIRVFRWFEREGDFGGTAVRVGASVFYEFGR